MRFGGPGKCTGAFGFRVRVEGRKDFSEIFALRDSPKTPKEPHEDTFQKALSLCCPRRLCAFWGALENARELSGSGFGLRAARTACVFRDFCTT